jgi:hypothetical protein
MRNQGRILTAKDTEGKREKGVVLYYYLWYMYEADCALAGRLLHPGIG